MASQNELKEDQKEVEILQVFLVRSIETREAPLLADPARAEEKKKKLKTAKELEAELAKASSSRRRPRFSTSKPPRKVSTASRIELIELQMRLAQEEFDAQQRRLDADEARKKTEFSVMMRAAAADEERRATKFELKKKLLDARLASLMSTLK